MAQNRKRCCFNGIWMIVLLTGSVGSPGETLASSGFVCVSKQFVLQDLKDEAVW